MHEHEIRKQIIQFGKLCYDRNLLVAMDGNLSAMLPSGHIVCTKAGCHKGFLTDDDLVSAGYRAHPFDKEGNYVGAPTVRAPEPTISKGPRNMTRAPNFTGTA